MVGTLPIFCAVVNTKRLLPGHPLANRSTGFEADESGRTCEYCGESIDEDAEEAVCENCASELQSKSDAPMNLCSFIAWFERKFESGLDNTTHNKKDNT